MHESQLSHTQDVFCDNFLSQYGQTSYDVKVEMLFFLLL